MLKTVFPIQVKRGRDYWMESALATVIRSDLHEHESYELEQFQRVIALSKIELTSIVDLF